MVAGLQNHPMAEFYIPDAAIADGRIPVLQESTLTKATAEPTPSCCSMRRIPTRAWRSSRTTFATPLTFRVKGGGKLDRADTTTSQRWQSLDQSLPPATLRQPTPAMSARRTTPDSTSTRLFPTPIHCAIIGLNIEYFSRTRWISPCPHPCSPCQPPSNHRATATRCCGPVGCAVVATYAAVRQPRSPGATSNVGPAAVAHPHHPLQARLYAF